MSCFFCDKEITHVNDGGTGFYAFDPNGQEVIFCWTTECPGLEKVEQRGDYLYVTDRF